MPDTTDVSVQHFAAIAELIDLTMRLPGVTADQGLSAVTRRYGATKEAQRLADRLSAWMRQPNA